MKVWYFRLESVNGRYTQQLSETWMPNAFKCANLDFEAIDPVMPAQEITVGCVLDAYGRSKYSMAQVALFLDRMAQGEVKSGDVIFLQDFWTPGIESVFYAAELAGIKLKLYSMLHAQSVDIYDFTFPMREWMSSIELGYDRYHSGIFVASTIHKEQLRAAGFTAPIHVVGLPIDFDAVQTELGEPIWSFKNRKNQVVFTSRIDEEKQPHFMLQVAELFLDRNPDWEWVVSTGSAIFRSNQDGIVDQLKALAVKNPRFKLQSGMSKLGYYQLLNDSKIQFNCSLQDYVSWTLLEATALGCDIVYPNFRSFPECVPTDRLYDMLNVEDALLVLGKAIRNPTRHVEIPIKCHKGRLLEAEIIKNQPEYEVNIWV